MFLISELLILFSLINFVNLIKRIFNKRLSFMFFKNLVIEWFFLINNLLILKLISF